MDAVKHWTGAACAIALAVSLVAVAAAQPGRTAGVEVRVWQDARDARALYVSARPEGGSWRALGTIPLDMRGLSASGRFRFGDVALAVPLPDAQPGRTAGVEVRVWQDARDARALYVSARPEGGSWRALGTIPLDMRGPGANGRFRFGDVALAVPLPDAPAPTATPEPTPTPSPSSAVCERPTDADSLPPAVFTGSALLNGRPASGAIVVATVGDACCASATVGADSAYTLLVPSGCGAEGDAVAFTVGGVPATETGVWSNLTLNRLDLGASR